MLALTASKPPKGKTRTVGDVAPEVAEVAAALSPVPGGVGAMTTTILLGINGCSS